MKTLKTTPGIVGMVLYMHMSGETYVLIFPNLIIHYKPWICKCGPSHDLCVHGRGGVTLRSSQLKQAQLVVWNQTGQDVVYLCVPVVFPIPRLKNCAVDPRGPLVEMLAMLAF